jgi:hypothetical protein
MRTLNTKTTCKLERVEPDAKAIDCSAMLYLDRWCSWNSFMRLFITFGLLVLSSPCSSLRIVLLIYLQKLS